MSASDVGKDTPRLKLGMYMRKRVKEPSHGQWVRVAGRCPEPNRDRVMTGLGRRLHRGHLSGTCGVHIVQGDGFRGGHVGEKHKRMRANNLLFHNGFEILVQERIVAGNLLAHAAEQPKALIVARHTCRVTTAGNNNLWAAHTNTTRVVNDMGRVRGRYIIGRYHGWYRTGCRHGHDRALGRGSGSGRWCQSVSDEGSRWGLCKVIEVRHEVM